MKLYWLNILLFLSFSLAAQNTVYRTQVFNKDIKTLQIQPSDKPDALPVIELNGSTFLTISFDELSHRAHSYTYKVMHCNADWTISSLNSMEYISGFTSANISNYALSVNTTTLYTHYAFQLPNDEMRFKVSGNYVVQVYEDNNSDRPIAQACFHVLDARVQVNGTVRGNTDTELSGRYQQLDFELGLNGYPVRDAATEIKTIVRQNNRWDNQVVDLKPTFFSSSKLSYINNRALIFEGGTEYHRFDISSVFGGGEGVDIIRFDQTQYHAFLFPNKIPVTKSYTQDQDVNGRYVVHMQRAQDEVVEADYMLVHLSIPTKQVFLDGQLYVGGDFNQNLLNENNRMMYDAQTECYFLNVLLKQGGYNYQFWFLPKGQRKATLERIDGSYWQTRNEYTVYVYHRAWGERYDRLVAVKTIE